MSYSGMRGTMLDLAVFAFNVLLVRGLVGIANGFVHAAADDTRAKLAVGLFFAALLVLQPLGPAFKRWSFHQRHAFNMESTAGCFLLWYMVVYLVMMLALCTTALVILGGIFARGSPAGDAAVALLFPGLAWSILSVVIVYRYFVPPAKPPRWTFLSTPAAERLGDAFVYLNAIGLQIVWSAVTASAAFRELVTGTPLGRPGSLSDMIGRVAAITAAALLLYLPARIYYLAEDKHHGLTAVTMVLANLPLVVRTALAPSWRL